ncbi:MAG: TatD family hydrolase [Clostridia bacterium]|nr:TatD family hydrolase [Clostridia bacterium]
MPEQEMLAWDGLFDSHAHYFDSRFEGQADDLLANGIFGKGVAGIVNVATNPENALRCIEQTSRYPRMWCAVGIHPEDGQNDVKDPDAALSAIRDLLDTEEKRRANKIVALGEIGLDYHWQPVDKERQMYLFEAQLDMARELSLPVIIHDREAHGDCFETVLKYPEVKGVFHSFSGSAEMTKELTRRGWYISFSGVLTFKNARKVREVAAVVPHDRILVETDCPYLAPEPFRGRMNHSGLMSYTAKTLSELLALSYEETVALTAKNAKELFGIE